MSAPRLLPVALAALSLFQIEAALAQEAPPATDRSVLETVVVTSQKRLEDVRKVPLSVTAIGGDALKETQITDITDLTRNVPNVSFNSQGGAGLSTIEIRGVSSQAGSATVGVYLDDVSLTTRNLYSQGTAEPRFFDIERVEVLRGPQGTLYGAGSLGGTLRFISKAPSLRGTTVDVHAEVSSTSHGGTNYMGQAVLNLPLKTDQAALRIGVQSGHDSGYIDQVDPKTLAVIDRGINKVDWSVLKAALKVKINNDWSITPALFYQVNKTADIDAAYLSVGGYQQYNAGVPLAPFQTSKIVKEPGKDTLSLPSLLVNGDLGFADFTGLINRYDRKFNRTQDGTNVNSSYIGSLITNPTVANIVTYLPSAVYLDNKIGQNSLELRLASKDVTPGGLPITWVAGFFSAQTKTDVTDNEPVFGINKAFSSNGANIYDPNQWSSGAGIFDNAFPNDNSYFSARHYNTKQNSVFGELTYHAAADVRLIAGLRYLQATEDFHREGDFFFAGGPSTTAVSSKANKLTPRFAMDWDVDKNNTLYVNVAEGFRLGGANRPIPLSIQGNVDDLAKLGLKAAPASFAPDSLWSYELGTKSRLLDNRVTLNAAIYHINWKNIQQDVYLPTAGFDFETNVGRATSDGVELELRARVTPDFTFSAGGGYNHAVFAEDVPFLGVDAQGLPNVRKGDHVVGVPEYSIKIGGEYQFRLADMDSVIRLNVQRTGKSNGSLVRTDPDYNRPGYTTVDASWGLTAGRWDINLSVKNLTNNRTILQKPNIQSVSEAFYLRPRTIGLGVSSSF
ncbi:TonB-dependent receptor [Roseateles saccharophilus]|uniref:Outer membrane receptor protein involved in Fe transport n=1 Tax=Roseateles saccharophilus TaxID=304 RepID=A0A4R3UII2_ROSSA|nr:TonB-dependent receptor [Roseateles saccharophilus]MDG0834488.1 TonB-dependent receptor [Roseateles saccharophilus]TCU89776.1 outer membrane receptor protein involved in Fe transport [Roseateles saccharophilus]